MTVYYINLLLILVLGFFLCIKNPSKEKKLIYLIITFGYMWFLATFRSGIGYDYQSYIDIFRRIDGTFWSTMHTVPYEWGFKVLTKVMTFFISSTVVMYGVYSFLILAPVVYFIYRYCDDAWLATWLYVTLAFFYSNMNFIRQSLACSIALFGFGFLLRRKTIPFLLVVLLASTFHVTALVLIPIYFLAHIPFTVKRVVLYVGTVFLLYIFSNQILYAITRVVFQHYWGSRYLVKYLGGIFMLIPMVALVAGIALYPVWKKRDDHANLFLNILIFNATIWLFGATKHMIVERFSMYSYIYTLVALPSALRSLQAGPELIEERDHLQQLASGGKKLPASQMSRLSHLQEQVEDHKHYYWAAVIAILLVTFFYNYFGMYINKFHNVFPYQSVISWLN